MRTARENKKFKEILVNPAQKQGKVISQNTIVFVLTMHEDDKFSRQMLGKKHYVSVAKGVHKKKNSCFMQPREMYPAFKEKYRNVKLRVSKF